MTAHAETDKIIALAAEVNRLRAKLEAVQAAKAELIRKHNARVR